MITLYFTLSFVEEARSWVLPQIWQICVYPGIIASFFTSYILVHNLAQDI